MKIFDKNGTEIERGDTIIYNNLEYIIEFGEGAYDGGHYTYIGWYAMLKTRVLDGYTKDDAFGAGDGNGYILTLTEDIEVIRKKHYEI